MSKETTPEEIENWEKALDIIDTNLSVEDGVICNRFATASKIVEFSKNLKSATDNPIKDNRIVNDRSFARRLKGHLKGLEANCEMGVEEIEYLQKVAEKLLKHQIETCPSDEEWYHLNCDPSIEFKTKEPCTKRKI